MCTWPVNWITTYVCAERRIRSHPLYYLPNKQPAMYSGYVQYAAASFWAFPYTPKTVLFTIQCVWLIMVHIFNSEILQFAVSSPQQKGKTQTLPQLNPPRSVSSVNIEVPSSPFGTQMVPGRENLALKAFIKCFNEVHSAILPHTKWLAEKVSAKLIIPKESCDSLLLGPVLHPSQSASILLSLIQSAISKDYRCLRRFVRVLKKQENLKPVAENLIRSYRKFLANVLLLKYVYPS